MWAGGTHHILKLGIVILLVLLIAACALLRTVRQQDLDAWIGVPVEALDLHSFFLTVPMLRTITASGIEIRNYANGRDFSQCFGSGGAYKGGNLVNYNTFTTCSSNRIVCNNIFYIKEGMVVEYAPTGRCYTDEFVQPEPRYLRFQNQMSPRQQENPTTSTPPSVNPATHSIFQLPY